MIDRDELKIVCKCFFGNFYIEKDSSLKYVNESNWEDLFKAIDGENQDGMIDYPEFKKFYDVVLCSSSQDNFV